jgi:hypothetical protein
MATYVPGTGEVDLKKYAMSLQQIGPKLDTAQTNIATNTSNIATNTSSIAAMQAAWTTWTPTATPQTGAFTTVATSGAYLAIGKLVHFSLTVSITTAGTASGTISVSLPIGTAKRSAAVFVQDFGATGTVGFGRIQPNASAIVSILKYDNSTYIGSGNSLVMTGIYEQN